MVWRIARVRSTEQSGVVKQKRSNCSVATVTVKVLNSYEKCIFTPDPGFGYLPGWELSDGVFRRCRVDTG